MARDDGGNGGESKTSGTSIPRGMEILVKKASVDPAFRAKLLDERDDAAPSIGLTLEASEAAILRAIPRSQLEANIAQAKVSPTHRGVFCGCSAVAMLAVLGLVTSVFTMTTGHASDRPLLREVRPHKGHPSRRGFPPRGMAPGPDAMKSAPALPATTGDAEATKATTSPVAPAPREEKK